MKIKGSLGCSDHELKQSRILRAESRVKCKLITPEFRRADFVLFKDLLIKSHGIRHWREDKPKKIGWYSRITSSRQKRVPL